MKTKSALFTMAALLLSACANFGTSPDQEQTQTFLKSKQYNSETRMFQNRRPGLIAKAREEAMSLSFIWEWFQGGVDSTPTEKLPESKVDMTAFLSESNKLKFIWLGHSSLLLNFQGKIILIDPVFSGSASPVSFVARRFQPPVITLKDLPKIDVILISHDHYDHLDMKTIKFFRNKEVTFVTPLGVGSHLAGWGVNKDKIVEKDWMASYSFKGVKFTATPAQHFSGRGLSDENKTLWASWVIQSGKYRIFFSGDSGYDQHFKVIGDTFGPFDIAFMENGQYDANFTAGHMLPEQVAVAYKELKAKKVFPIHWGMFALNRHPWYEPPKRLVKALKVKADILTPRIGFLYDLDRPVTLEKWWNSFPRGNRANGGE